MQPHIEKAYQFLNDHLPFEYVKETHEVLKKSKLEFSSTIIRNVKSKKTTTNIHVLNALLKVAKKHKIANEALVVETLN
jgi:hypothetical protein